MREHHIGVLIVTETKNGVRKPIGIITDRDIVVEILAKQLEPNLFRIKDIMISPVITIGETQDLSTALRLMRTNGIRRLPVVNDYTQELIGIITIDDIIGQLAGDLSALNRAITAERLEESYFRP
jgi:CBS domain-containing protein